MKHTLEILKSTEIREKSTRRWLRRRPAICAGLLQVVSAIGRAQSQGRDLTDLSLEQLQALKVTSASLHDQKLEDAPASITVITAGGNRTVGSRRLPAALDP